MTSIRYVLTETEFYDRLAKAYDVMNDWAARLAAEMPFIEKQLAGAGAVDILDCACGTGQHAIALAQHGYHVEASDASPEMVQRARENVAAAHLNLAPKVALFRDLGSTYLGKFDSLLCLGNSFPHVIADNEARASLTAMHGCLRPNGSLIIQSLNNDKRWKDKPRWFAVNSGVVDGDQTLIWRFADYGTSLITFNIAMFTRKLDENWTVDVQSTPQKPYQKDELDKLLADAGFHDMAYYGDLRGSPFDIGTSGDLVIVARA